MQKIRCCNCMKELNRGAGKEPCPYCGFDERKSPQPGNALARMTVLKERYLAGNVLGQGGFGITYVGYDLVLEMKVAIKEYFPSGIAYRGSTAITDASSGSSVVQWDNAQKSQQQFSMDRFLKEARSMAKLDDVPNIVRVKDTFHENETAYIIMDFVEGSTLKQYLMDNGIMKLDACLELLGPVMDSLSVIHDKGFIHRDISPDNIMIQPDKTARLLDMGAAVDTEAHGGQASTSVVKKFFSAPELYVSNSKLDRRVDVYSMGATVYYCLTGKLIPEAVERVMKGGGTIPAPNPRLGIPEYAMSAIRDALNLNAADRIGSMRELKARLENGGTSNMTGSKCTKCNGLIYPGDKVCRYCGTPVLDTGDSNSQNRSQAGNDAGAVSQGKASADNTGMNSASGMQSGYYTGGSYMNSGYPGAVYPNGVNPHTGNTMDGGIVNSGNPNSSYPNSGNPNGAYPNSAYVNNGYPASGYINTGYVNNGYPGGYPNSAYVNNAYPNSAYVNNGIPNSSIPNSSIPNSSIPNSSYVNSAIPNSTSVNTAGGSNGGGSKGKIIVIVLVAVIAILAVIIISMVIRRPSSGVQPQQRMVPDERMEQMLESSGSSEDSDSAAGNGQRMPGGNGQMRMPQGGQGNQNGNTGSSGTGSSSSDSSGFSSSGSGSAGSGSSGSESAVSGEQNMRQQGGPQGNMLQRQEMEGGGSSESSTQ